MAITGTELALTVRENFPQIFLSMVEEFSHVLVEMLMRQEVDFILCYDVPDQPEFSRIALLQEDFVFVTPPAVHTWPVASFRGNTAFRPLSE
jgi:LysR family nitrogen assimilation transcriptional regulator